MRMTVSHVLLLSDEKQLRATHQDIGCPVRRPRWKQRFIYRTLPNSSAETIDMPMSALISSRFI